MKIQYLIKTHSLSILILMFLSSCNGNKQDLVNMSDVVKYFSAKGYDGDVGVNSNITEESNEPYSEVIRLSNIESVLEKMRMNGYFLNNVKKVDFVLGENNMGKIITYGGFNPFSIIIYKRNDGYSGPEQFQEDEYFKVGIVENQSGYPSNYRKKFAEKIIKEINTMIKSGTFKLPEVLGRPQQVADSSLLVGKEFNAIELGNVQDGSLHFPLQLIEIGNGFLWVAANAKKEFIDGTMQYAGLGYSLYYFDKNGFLKWTEGGIHSISPEDRYAIEAYKTTADTMSLLVRHNIMTYDVQSRPDLCYEVYIQKYDLKTGKTIGRQTISKHFNKDVKEAFQDRIPVGMKQDVATYFSSNDLYNEMEKSLVSTFTNTDFIKQYGNWDDSGEFQYTTRNKYDSSRPFSARKKKLNELVDRKTSIDKYFLDYECITYSRENKRYLAIAKGENFYRQQFYYIKIVDVNGKSRPIILKTAS